MTKKSVSLVNNLSSLIGIVIVCICLIGGNASAIASFCSTGHSGENAHGPIKAGISRANNELNDHYKDGHHSKDTNGRDRGDLLMTIHSDQPQHYIQFSHAVAEGEAKGRNMDIGEGSRDSVWYHHWMGYVAPMQPTEPGIKPAKSGLDNAALPFSMVQCINSYSGYYRDYKSTPNDN